jgi:hypothetical protein
MAIYGGMVNKLEAIKELGDIYWKANVAGVKTKEQGQCLALVCMAKGIDPFTFAEEYHMVDGKPTLQAHNILKRIRRAGHDVDWKSDLDAQDKAEAVFTVGGRATPVRYSIDEAKKSVSSFAKDGSPWQKTPAAMLRAAVLRKGAKALCPEVLTGEVDPDEFPEPPRVAVVGNGVATNGADVEARRRELQAMSQQPATTDVPATTEPVIDAVVEPVASTAPKTETPPFEVPDRPSEPSPEQFALTKVLMEIDTIAQQIGMSRADLEGKLKAANPGFAGLENLEISAAEKLLENLRAKVAQTQPAK